MAKKGQWETRLRKLPPFERTLSAILLEAKETVLGPMRPKLREHGLTEPQWRVLRLLTDWGATEATGLAEGGYLHAPSVARILKELEKRKFIRRMHDPEDRRRILAMLTPEGAEMVMILAEEVARIKDEFASRFGPERLEWLQGELRDLAIAIKDVEIE